jgi:hypothetical protein
MIELTSQLEGKRFDLYQLEQALKPMGYSIGGNWDYDQGSFDYKIADEPGYQFLRLPFTAVEGQLDAKNCVVEFRRPFLLGHVYQEGLDDHVHVDNSNASFNQFSEPVEKDGDVPDRFVKIGKTLIKDVENALL